MTAKSRASRILAHLGAYRDLTRGAPERPTWLDEVEFQEGENCLGIYENDLEAVTDSIVVTDRGLYARRGETWEFVGFDNIEAVRIAEPKSEASEVTVISHDGAITRLPVRGGGEKFRDAWEFMRFLIRVKEDVDRQKGLRP